MAISVSIRVFHDIGDTPSDNSAAQAGCAATCTSYYSGTKTYTGGHPRPGESGGTTSVAYTNYQLTATPATGWYFKGWDVITRNYVTGGLDSQGNVRTDVEITTERTYHSGTNPYPANTTATDYEFPGDLAEANPGYDWRRHTFKWEIIAVYAQFEQGAPPATYTVTATASPSNGGTVKVGESAAGSTSTLTNVTAGSTVTVVATPATGYHFVRWMDGGAQTHDITVNSDVDLTAIFESDTPPPAVDVTVTLDANGGSVSPTTLTYANPTGATTYGWLPTPSGPSGSYFAGWFTAASGGTQVADTSALVSLSDHTLYAHWVYRIAAGRYNERNPPPPSQEEAYVALNGVRDDNGAIIAIAQSDLPAGTQVTLSAIVTGVNPYLRFLHWVLLGPNDGWTAVGSVVSGAGATFTRTVQALADYYQRYRADFVDIRITITAYADGRVTINGQGGGTEESAFLPPGDTVTLVCGLTDTSQSFPEYYRFIHWTDTSTSGSIHDDNVLTTNLAYTFTVSGSPQSVQEYYARYAECDNVSTRVSPEGGGTITISRPPDSPPSNPGEQWYLMYEPLSFTATAKPGYRFVKWEEYWIYLDREIWWGEGYDAQYTIASLQRTTLIVAHFELIGGGQLIYDDATGRLICADATGQLIYHDKMITNH